MKNIIIFYEHVVRELDSCISLKNILGDSFNIYIYQIPFQFPEAKRLVKSQTIDMVIMPSLYNEEAYYILKNFIKANRNIIIINLHHEQIGSNMFNCIGTLKSEYQNRIIHFCWTERFKKELMKIGVNSNYIFVTGNMRLDDVFKTQKNKTDIGREFNLDINKKWILLTETRGWAFDVDKLNKKNCVFSSNEEYIMTYNSLKKTERDLNSLDNSFFKKYELIYRPHPGTKNKLSLRKEIKIISKYSIYDWLHIVDYNMTWTSTSVFEAEACNVPVFVINTDEIHDKYKAEGLEKYTEVENVDQIDDILSIKNNPSEKIYLEYIGECEGNNTQKNALIIKNLLTNGVSGYRAKEMKISLKSFYKNLWLSVMPQIAKIVVKLNLLEKIQFPKTAYIQIENLPFKEKK